MPVRVVAQNFKCFKQVDLTLEQGSCKVVLGDSTATDYSVSNGAGKSSLMHLLSWAFTGQYPGMTKADDVINNNSKSCSVWAQFEDPTGKPCVIVRTRGPAGLEFWRDNNKITGDIKTVQAAIEAACGFDYKFFSTVYLHTGADDTRFAAMTDGSRKRLMSMLLPYDFTAAGVLAKSKLATAQRDCEAARNRNATSQRYLAETQRELAQAVESERAWAASQASRTNTVDVPALQRQLSGTQKVLADLEHAWRQLLQHQQELDRASDKAADKQQQWKSAQQHNQQCRERLAAAEANALATHAGPSTACPTCGQAMHGEHWEQARNRMQAVWERAYADWQASEQSLQARATEAANALQVAENLYNAGPNTNLAAHTIEQDMAAYQSTIAQLQTEIARASVQQETQNPFTAVKAHLEAKLQQHTSESETSYQQVVALEAQQKLLKEAVTAFGPSGISAYLLDRLCPALTAIASTVMSALSDSELTIKFEADLSSKDQFKVVATKKCLDGSTLEGYTRLSGGERARVDLAAFLAIYTLARRNVCDLGFLVLDEVADALCDQGKDRVLEALRTFCADYKVAALVLTNDSRVASAGELETLVCRMGADGVSRVEVR